MTDVGALNRLFFETPHAALCRLAAAGVGLEAGGSDLYARLPPGGALADDDAATIRRHKPALLALLSPHPPCGISPTPDEELAFEQDCMRKRAARLPPGEARDMALAACDHGTILEALWRMRQAKEGVPPGSRVTWAAWARDAGGRWRRVGSADDWRSAWRLLLDLRAAEKAVLPAGQPPAGGQVDDDPEDDAASGRGAGREPGGHAAARTEGLGGRPGQGRGGPGGGAEAAAGPHLGATGDGGRDAGP